MNTQCCNVPTKLCIVVVALTLAVACGCAYRAKQPLGVRPVESHVGWVRFVGEFVLYDDKSAFEGARRDHCISGALPLEKQQVAAKKMDGRRVKVTGVRITWSLPDPLAVSLNNDGSPITNWCGGNFILFATDMVPE